MIVASDTFGQKNQGQTIAEGLAETRAMLRFAKVEGLRAQVTISARVRLSVRRRGEA